MSEPVAWMFEKDGAYMCLKHMDGVRFDGGIPLYTHPMRELTDEEIDDLIHEYNCIDDYCHEFVRACIKKASEK